MEAPMATPATPPAKPAEKKVRDLLPGEDPGEGFYPHEEAHHDHSEVAERLFAVPEVPSASSVWGFFSSTATAASQLVVQAADSDFARQASDVASAAASRAAEVAMSTHSDFLSEQGRFMSAERPAAYETTDTASAQLPWEPASPHSKEIRERVLRLSAEDAVFLTPPPAEVDFTFDFETNAGPAILMLEADPQVSTRRFKLVPKTVDESSFWRNYFYRVSLITSSYAVAEAPSAEQTAALERHMEGAADIQPDGDPEDALTLTENDVVSAEEGAAFASDDVLLTGEVAGAGRSGAREDSGASWEDELRAELGEDVDFEANEWQQLGDKDLLEKGVEEEVDAELEARIKEELNLDA